MNGTKLITILLVVLMVVVAAEAARRRAPVERDGYPLPQTDPRNPWLPLVFMVVALAGVLVVAFKNARRTHLD